MTKAILFSLSILFLSACKITNIPEELVTVPQPQVVGLAEPNHYLVRLPLPDGAQATRRLEKSEDLSVKADFETLPAKIESGQFIDDQVLAGHHYIYQIEDSDGDPVSVYEVQIPTDLSIQDEMLLQKDEMWTSFGRVFLGPKGILTTNGHQVFIQADQLISNHGKIRSFQSVENSAMGAKGNSGGNIQMFLKQASGDLNIEMRGQNGGAGTKGSTLPADPPIPPIIFPGGFGGLSILTGPRNFLSYFKTKPGGAGSPGGNGGASGRFSISISQAHSLQLHAEIIEGQPGPGGEGGAPQAIGGFCDSLGDAGANGASGANGTKEISCLNDFRGQICW